MYNYIDTNIIMQLIFIKNKQRKESKREGKDKKGISKTINYRTPCKWCFTLINQKRKRKLHVNLSFPRILTFLNLKKTNV